MIRWAGKSTMLHWQLLSVALLLNIMPAQPTLNELKFFFKGEEKKRENPKSSTIVHHISNLWSANYLALAALLDF